MVLALSLKDPNSTPPHICIPFKDPSPPHPPPIQSYNRSVFSVVACNDIINFGHDIMPTLQVF